MYGEGIADAFVTFILIVIVVCLLVGAGLGWLLPWVWHHLSFGWK